MKKMVDVSVIIPVYNVEKYLRECLNSVYSLDLSNKEIIIINDGSTDSSVDIVNEYKNKYNDKTKIISQKNQGLAEARNTGIKNSTGEYILFVDSDDFIEPIEAEEFFNFAVEKKVDILIGNYREYYGKNKIIDKEFYKINKNVKKEGMFYIENGFKNNCFEVVVWRNLYNRECLLKNNLFFKKGLLHEDNLFTPMVFYYATKTRYYNKKFYFYRKNNFSSIMQTKSKKNYEHMLYIINELLKFKDMNGLDNRYFNRLILGMYLSILRQGKYKNEDIFNKLKKINFNFREKLKLLYIYLFYIYNINKIQKIEIAELK